MHEVDLADDEMICRDLRRHDTGNPFDRFFHSM